MPGRSETGLRETTPPEALRLPEEDNRRAASRLRRLNGSRRKYEQRKAAGWCAQGGCRARVEAGHTLCRRHLRQMSRRNQLRYRERSDYARCIYCGERPGFWGVRCVICRQRFAKDPLPFGARRALRLFREAEEKYRAEQLEVAARLAARQLLTTGELTGKRAEALRLYAGMDNGKWRSYNEVGRLMNLSKERVRQLLQPAKLLLAQRLADNLPWKLIGNVAGGSNNHQQRVKKRTP